MKTSLKILISSFFLFLASCGSNPDKDVDFTDISLKFLKELKNGYKAANGSEIISRGNNLYYSLRSKGNVVDSGTTVNFTCIYEQKSTEFMAMQVPDKEHEKKYSDEIQNFISTYPGALGLLRIQFSEVNVRYEILSNTTNSNEQSVPSEDKVRKFDEKCNNIKPHDFYFQPVLEKRKWVVGSMNEQVISFQDINTSNSYYQKSTPLNRATRLNAQFFVALDVNELSAPSWILDALPSVLEEQEHSSNAYRVNYDKSSGSIELSSRYNLCRLAISVKTRDAVLNFADVVNKNIIYFDGVVEGLKTFDSSGCSASEKELLKSLNEGDEIRLQWNIEPVQNSSDSTKSSFQFLLKDSLGHVNAFDFGNNLRAL